MARRPDAAGVRAYVARLLLEYAAQFQKLARRVQRRVEGESVHDLRVLTRRIRSAVWVARHLAPDYPFRLLRGALRRLGSALGRRRQLDVARGDAPEFGLDGSRLDRRLAREGASLAQELNEVHRAVIVAGLRAASRTVERAREERLAGALETRIQGLGTALAQAPRGHAELHRLRIEAKKTRYLLEAMGRKGDFIRELQRRSGRAHDLQVLQQFYRPDERIERHAHRARLGAHRIMEGVVARATAALHDCILALRGQPPEGSVRGKKRTPSAAVPTVAPASPPDDGPSERAAS